MARKKDGVWYVGSMTGNKGRQVTVDLGHLVDIASARNISITLYEDEPNVDTQTHVRVTKRTIRKLSKRNQTLTLNLCDRGGAAMTIATE